MSEFQEIIQCSMTETQGRRKTNGKFTHEYPVGSVYSGTRYCFVRR
jgi:hypothetical protein